MRDCFLYLLLILFGFSPLLQGEEHGTIIVTYQTNSERERLDLIRFWLVNSENEKTLYPQKDEAVPSQCSANERTVVISSLPVGRYKIEFLIPNRDQLFQEISPREIVLTANQIVKVDQMIPTRSTPLSNSKETFEIAQLALNPIYHSRSAYYPYPSRSAYYPYHSAPLVRPWSPLPPLQTKPISSATFSLKSNKPARWRLMLRGRVVYSGMDSISNLYLPPGQQYYLITENIPGYIVHSAPRSPFDLFPNQIMNMEVFYQPQIPPIILKEEAPARQPASSLKGNLRVVADSSQALFTLKTETGTIVARGQGYYSLIENLNPGHYLVDFSNTDKHLIPLSPHEGVEILPNQTKEIKMQYRRSKPSEPMSTQKNKL